MDDPLNKRRFTDYLNKRTHEILLSIYIKEFSSREHRSQIVDMKGRFKIYAEFRISGHVSFMQEAAVGERKSFSCCRILIEV